MYEGVSMTDLNPNSDLTSRNQFCEAARDIDFLERESYVGGVAVAVGFVAAFPVAVMGSVGGPLTTAAAGVATVAATTAAILYVDNKIADHQRQTPAKPEAGLDCVGQFMKTANALKADVELDGLRSDKMAWVKESVGRYPDVQKAMFSKEYPAGPDDIRISTENTPKGKINFVLSRPSGPVQ